MMASRNFDKTYKNATLSEGKKEQLISDGGNLYMRLRSGKKGVKKSWQFNYHHPTTKKRIKLALGDYPELSLEDARNKASEYRKLLVKDIDPQDHLKNAATQGKVLFRDVAERWFVEMIYDVEQENIANKIAAAHKRARDNGLKKASDLEVADLSSPKNNRNSERIRGHLKNHIYPAIGDMPINSLEAYHLKNGLQSSIQSGINMNKIIADANRVMRYAKNEGIIKDNPFADLGANFRKKSVKKQPTIHPNGLGEVMKAVGDSSIKTVTRCAFEMQLHILSRPNENVRLRWDEIDFERNLIIIPKYRMKKDYDFYIPLTKYTQGILEFMKPISFERSEYVFPNAAGSAKPYLDPQTVNKVLRDNGFRGELVAHGFRSVGSTYLNEAKEGTRKKYDSDIIEASLAHTDKDNIREIYNNAEYIDLRRIALTDWGDFIAEQTGFSNSIAARFK
ncbi:tyrosine-type recombinase/integrase [Vibrio parahaemolyticus]|nr:tyrosine-type recombinase/integrase [Vibrio parahaemolyticus]EGR2992132.1 DUF4102 domain-containing protein [Vibrio parahaemolyticus]EGR3242457.1 integrase [Vibrio parahaemolyticus]EJG0217082.1 tyrosine-type recombinase/integrase [Vibrio parahaemolyticus]